MSKTYSNAAVSAAEAVAACDRVLLRVSQLRKEKRDKYIAGKRAGLFRWFYRNMTDEQLWDAADTCTSMGVDLLYYASEIVAEDIKALAQRVLDQGGTTININASDYSHLRNFWRKDENNGA